MCGIFGYVSKEEKPISFLVNGLKNLEYRGYDSWGVAIKKPNGVEVYKQVGKISEAAKGKPLGFSPSTPGVEELTASGVDPSKFSALSSNIGISHTRWATHGAVTEENAHPHKDCTGDVVIVHNGVIENYQTLRDYLKKTGHKFVSQTDTEVFAHLVEEKLKGRKADEASFLKWVREAFKELKGRNAVLVIHKDFDVVVAFRNGSPLVAGVGDGVFYLASDIPAFLKDTDKVVFLEDDEGIIVSPSFCKKIDVFGGEKDLNVEAVSWEAEDVEKGSFDHFLIKEIYDQPEVIKKVAATSDEEIRKVGELIKDAYGTYITACGTASYAALAATYFFSSLAGHHVNFSPASEFPLLSDFLKKESLFIAASQSGETADTIEAAKAAKAKGSKVVSVVNVAGSSLDRMSDARIYLKAGPERAVLSTKTYLAKLSVFLLLSYELKGKLEEGKKLLIKTSELVAGMFEDGLEEKVRELAENLYKVEHIYTVGRGLNYPTALEAALKIKEVSYIHAEGFAGGELKHGVIALIEEGTPCIAFVANDDSKDDTLINAAELKLRGGYIIGVSPENNEIFDWWVKVPDISYASPIVNVIPAQMLGYHLAVQRGFDPDKPRNLAKSVTVK